MAKIKGWVKVDRPKQFKDVLYRNYTTYAELSISKGERSNLWFVRLGEGEPRFFHTKTNALRFAISYMRRH